MIAYYLRRFSRLLTEHIDGPLLGAVLFTVLSFTRPFAFPFILPSLQGIDERLIGGAVVFGLGWGLTGFCPGPAVASLVFGYWPSALFVLSMAAGMAIASHLFLGTDESPSDG